MNDRVGDFIVRLQNAAMADTRTVVVPHSNHLEEIAHKLKQLGFISDIAIDGSVKKIMTLTLAQDDRGAIRIRGVRRISKPGRRLYISHREAHRVKGGTGVRLVSTPKGVLSDTEARKVRVGGEDLFQIW